MLDAPASPARISQVQHGQHTQIAGLAIRRRRLRHPNDENEVRYKPED